MSVLEQFDEYLKENTTFYDCGKNFDSENYRVSINENNKNLVNLGEIDTNVVKSDTELINILQKEYNFDTYIEVSTFLLDQIILQSKTIENPIDKIKIIMDYAEEVNNYYIKLYPSTKYSLDYLPIDTDTILLTVKHSTVEITEFLMVNLVFSGSIKAQTLIDAAKENTDRAVMVSFIESLTADIDPDINVNILLYDIKRSDICRLVYPTCKVRLNYMNYCYNKFMNQSSNPKQYNLKVSTLEDDQLIQYRIKSRQELIQQFPHMADY